MDKKNKLAKRINLEKLKELIDPTKWEIIKAFETPIDKPIPKKKSGE